MTVQTIEIEAETIEEARKQIRSQIPTGFQFSEQVVSYGTQQTVRGIAETIEAAVAKAQKEIPNSANVTGQKELATPGQEVIKIEAFDERGVRTNIENRNAIVKNISSIESGKKGFLGIGKKPNHYEVEVFQQAVVEITYKPLAKISVTIQGRSGDGTILGDLIAKGVYRLRAGSEKIGYFDPLVAPFRTFPNAKTGLLGGAEADQQMEIERSTSSVFGNMFSESKDSTVDLAARLCRRLVCLRSSDLLEKFQELANNKAVSEFLLVTTAMPFFLTYSKDKVTVIAEVEYELKLNALVNLLINDKAFSSKLMWSPLSELLSKLESLKDDRKEIFEERKKWAIDFEKSRDRTKVQGD